MKSEALQAGVSGLKTQWDFRCVDKEALMVEGEILFPNRNLPGEMNKAELFAREIARQLGWHAAAPAVPQSAP